MNLPADTYDALKELKVTVDADSEANVAITPRSMPPSFYTNEAMTQAETEALFVNGWVCVGRADEIPDVGDYYTLELFSEPLIVTRNTDNQVIVLSNVCRHRGSQLLEGRGNSKRFTCPYHRWSYDLHGKLLSAPLVDKTEGFDREQCSLPSFKVHDWRGWVFVNLSGDAAPLDAHIVGLDDYVKNYHPEEMRSVVHPQNFGL